MLTSSSNLPQKSLKLKHDDKNFSKSVARDVSMANLSAEDYHAGASVAVPFTWESQPGTPKIKFRENPLPPLTPPPSYSYNNPKRPSKKLSNKSNLLETIFPKRSTRKTNPPVSPTSSSLSSSSPSQLSSSWSASYPVPSWPMKVSKSRGSSHGVLPCPRQYFDSGKLMLDHHDDQDHENEYESPLCSGLGRGATSGSRGCYASMIKVLLRDA